jgi:gluconolactonase
VALDALIDPKSRSQKIADVFKFTEGPVFSRRGYLLFSDIPSNRILKWERGNVSTLRENSNGANGLTFDHQGRLLACETGRVTRTEKNGQINALASTVSNVRTTWCMPSTEAFTSLTCRSRDSTRITRRGDVRVAAEDLTAERSRAERISTLYAADSKRVCCADSRMRAWCTLAGAGFAECLGDGLKTDEMGNVWVASEGGLWVFDSSGAKLGVVPTPEPPSNCNWGPGFRGLYITARTAVYFVPTRVSGTRTY